MATFSSKVNVHVKALLIVILVSLASVGGILAYHPVQGWPVDYSNFLVTPDLFHIVPGEGQVERVFIGRSAGFTGEVEVSLVNAPSWLTAEPLVIDPTASNGNLTIIASAQAPKGPIELTVQGTAAGGVTRTAQLAMKIVGAYPVNSNYGSALLYDTTKVFDSDNATLQGLVSYSDGTFVFSKSTPLLQGLDRGDVIVIDPHFSSVVPQGVLRLVLNVQQQGGDVVVVSRQAKLLDAFLQAQVGVTNSTYSGASSTNGLGTLAQTPRGFSAPDFLAIPLLPPAPVVVPPIAPQVGQWEGVESTLQINSPSLTFGADLLFGLDIYLNLDPFTNDPRGYQVIPTVDYFEVLLHGYEEASASIYSTGPLSVSYTKDDLAEIWSDNFIPIYFALWLDIRIDVGAAVEGHLTQAISFSVDQKLDWQIGPKYCSADFCGGKNFGWQLTNQVTEQHTVNSQFPPSLLSGSSLKVSLGPGIKVLLDSTTGQTSNFEIFAEFNSQIPHQPVWWLDGGLEGSIGYDFFEIGDIWSFSKDWSLEFTRFRMWDGPPQPIMVTITYPVDGSVLDATVHAQIPDFVAQVVDPQGRVNLCYQHGNPNVVWYSNVDGKFGTGCDFGVDQSILTELLTPGVQQVWVTATNPGTGEITKSSTATFTLRLPSITTVISAPSNGTQVAQGQNVNFVGSAYWSYDPQTPIPCNQLTWIEAGATIGQGCSIIASLNAQGAQTIQLVATVGKVSGSSIVNMIVGLPNVNLPPTVQIIQPTTGSTFYATLPVNGKVIGNYVSLTWVAQWPCADLTCNGNPQFSFTIPTGALVYPWDVAGTVCKGGNFNPVGGGGTILTRIVLTATDANGNSGSASVVINLGCYQTVQIITPFWSLAIGLVSLHRQELSVK